MLLIVDTFTVYIQAQYIFIPDAMSELVMCGETDIAAADIRISINQMKRNITGETITGFEKEFEVL